MHLISLLAPTYRLPVSISLKTTTKRRNEGLLSPSLLQLDATVYCHIAFITRSHSKNTQIPFFCFLFIKMGSELNLVSTLSLWEPEVYKVCYRKISKKAHFTVQLKPLFQSEFPLISPDAPLWPQHMLKCLCLNKPSRNSETVLILQFNMAP